MPLYRIQPLPGHGESNRSRNVLMESISGARDDYQVVTFAGAIDDARQLQTLGAHLGEELEEVLMDAGAYGFQFLPQDESHLYLHVVYSPDDINPDYDSFFALSQ